MKIRVLAFLGYYLPGYKSGGPVRTIANMVEQLGDQLEFRIVTRDRDVHDVEPYPGIQVDDWTRVGKAYVFYASPRTMMLRGVARLIRETDHDVLYLNSVFEPFFTGLPLLARRLGIVPRRPCVLAPRGEFSKGALAIKSWKKKPYLTLGCLLGLFTNLTWQASSKHELEDIKRVLGPLARHIRVAPDLPAPRKIKTDLVSRSTQAGEPFRIVFLSRITPMKNLDFALRVLARVSIPVEFNIYGPIRDERYWHECMGLMQLLPNHVVVKYKGEVLPNNVPDVFAKHDLFLFPTRGENFGHVILESLSVGTPVLISDKTFWTDDGRGGCNVRTLANPNEFVAVIEKMARASENARREYRLAAYAQAREFVERSDLTERTFRLFYEVAVSSENK